MKQRKETENKNGVKLKTFKNVESFKMDRLGGMLKRRPKKQTNLDVRKQTNKHLCKLCRY